MPPQNTKEGAVTTLIRSIAVLASLIVAELAVAQTYPTKSIRLVVPYTPGGPTDVVARIVAQKLSENWGQQIVAENLPGAGGNTATAMVAKAPPDGYTILVVSTGFLVNPSMYARAPFDPIKEFAPITLVASSPNVVFVNPAVPARTLKELIDVIKANPGRYSFSQPATGSSPHLAGELFKLKYAPDLVMVPFPGAAPAVTSTIGGHTPIGFTALPPAINNIKEGKLRGLALLADRRSAFLSDLPTNIEAGVPGLESDTLTGIVAPAGTPRGLIDMWRDAIAKMVTEPDVKTRLEALGFAPVANKPEEFGERIKVEVARWGQVVRDAHIRVD
jgi:tripartite-type tricarboxylate transporter receptor subunit TctC